MSRFMFVLSAVIAFSVACQESVHAGYRGAGNISPHREFRFHIESDGQIIPTYYYRGRIYVQGNYGDRYQIRVFNDTGERVEAVVTVDGRDVISGQLGDYRSERGYVIAPYSSVLIDGFRTSLDNVAAFRFTDIGDSYAARMGSDQNVGVIGVAIFKERQAPRPKPIAIYQPKSSLGTSYGTSAKESSGAPASSRSRSPADEADRSAESADEEYRAQNLGTQYGEQTYSPSSETRFTRRIQWWPDARLAIHYDDLQGLIAKGVIRDPEPIVHQRPLPDPFPSTPNNGFAPPPPGYPY